ncbi:MAG: Cell division protein DivIB [Firmicutes bacterium]|nr:Cell division protein DivIB [Bacillota bacterium]
MKSRKHLQKALVLLSLVFLFCWQIVYSAVFFSAETIEVLGAETVPARQIEELAGVWKGAPLLRLDLGEIERRLLADPRILSAEVTRVLPAKLRIRIEESIGLAVLPYHIGFIEIDRNGTVVSIVANFSLVNLPIITGISLSNVVLGDKLAGELFEGARAAMAAIPSNVRARISELHVTLAGEMSLTTTEGLRVKIGSPAGAPARLALLSAVLYAYEVRGLSPATVAYIDMTGEIPVYKGR